MGLFRESLTAPHSAAPFVEAEPQNRAVETSTQEEAQRV